MTDLSRRTLLAAAGATLAMPAAAARADDRLLYRKLRYRSDDGLVFWWMIGPKMGQVGATLTPLFTNNVGSIQRVRQRPDGGFDVTSLELVILAALDGGRRLERWTNPYSGETLPVRFRAVGPTTIRHRPDDSRVLPTTLGGASIEVQATIHPPTIVNDTVFVRDESVATVRSPGNPRPFVVNDISIFEGSLRQLRDRRVTSADATVFFAEVTGWQSWMKMGDRPGGLTSRTAGRKVRAYADMPPFWREALAEVAPEIARDPIGALDAAEHRFER